MIQTDNAVTLTMLVALASFVGGCVASLIGLLFQTRPQIVVQRYTGEKRGNQNEKFMF